MAKPPGSRGCPRAMLTSTIRGKDPPRAWRGRKFREVLEEAKRLVRAVAKAEGAAEERSVAPPRTGVGPGAPASMADGIRMSWVFMQALMQEAQVWLKSAQLGLINSIRPMYSTQPAQGGRCGVVVCRWSPRALIGPQGGGGGGYLVPLHVGTDTVHDLHGDEGRPGQMHLHRKRDLVAARIVVVLRMSE